MFVAAVVLIVAWGALAFGAVYPWAYAPLLVACALVGAAGLYLGRHRPVDRMLVICILALAAAVAVQLMPLPATVLRLASPSTDAFLRAHDLAYALGDTSHALSIRPEKTLLGLGFVSALGIFLVGLVRSLTPPRARQLAVSLVAFGVLLALVGIIQKALIGDHAFAGMKIYGVWSPRSRLTTPFGPFVNKNHFAGWMLMVIPLGIALAFGAFENAGRSLRRGLRGTLVWLSSPEGGRLQLFAVATVLMTGSLLLTKSRSGLGCLVVLLIAAGVASARRFEAGAGRWVTLGGLVAIFVGVFAWAGADVAARVGREMSAVDLRRNIWTDSARVIRDFPLAGTGLNTFGTAMLGYQTGDEGLHYQEAHNEYVQILVEGGLLLAIPALAIFVVLAATIRRRISASRADATGYWLRTGAVIGLVAIAVQSFAEFSLQMPGNAALFIVLMAIAIHSHGRSSAGSTRRQLDRTTV